MKNDKILYSKIVKLLREADSNLWQVAKLIHDSDNKDLILSVKALMNLRGEIIVELLFKIYKKFPELEPDYDISESELHEIDKMLDSLTFPDK